MTSAAVGQLDQFFMVIASDFLMAIQTETHVKYLRVFSNSQLRHIAVAILAVLSCRNMRAMIKLNKVRHLRHRHPFKRCSALHSLFQRRKQQAGFSLRNLIMTAPAFCL